MAKFLLSFNKNTKKKIKVWSWDAIILPEYIGKRFKIYQGKRFIDILISKNMVFHKFGEFAPTRQRHLFKKKRLKKK